MNHIIIILSYKPYWYSNRTLYERVYSSSFDECKVGLSIFC